MKLLLFKIYIYICDSEQHKNDQDIFKVIVHSYNNVFLSMQLYPRNYI